MMYCLSPILRSLNACPESLAWIAAERHPTFASAWAACPRHDWMTWLLGRTMPHREIVALACDLAEPALAHTSDPRPAACIEAVRRWRGEATIQEVREARAAANDAANAAYYAADAYAATYAANAAAAAARAQSLAQSRDIIRARFPARLVEARLIEIGRERGCLEVA